MQHASQPADGANTDENDSHVMHDGVGRRRPKPGERREQILQTLASMLEQPDGERITTAALAARLQVSEAALYRHFASKAQMFEGLIDFIERTIFSRINKTLETDSNPASSSAIHLGCRPNRVQRSSTPSTIQKVGCCAVFSAALPRTSRRKARVG